MLQLKHLTPNPFSCVNSRQMTPPFNPKLRYLIMQPLLSPFQTIPQSCPSSRPYQSVITPSQIQPHSRSCHERRSRLHPLPMHQPYFMPVMGSSTLSSIHKTCQSTLNQMQAEVDTLHAHYDLSRREKEEWTRFRTIERTTNRRRRFTLAKNHRRLVKEHLALRLQVARNNNRDVRGNEVQDKEEYSPNQKRQRPCLTMETLATFDEEALADSHYLCEKEGRPKTIGKLEEKVESPPKKIFRLNRRLWVQ